MPKHYIVYKCRGNYWEIRSSEVYFKFWRKVIFVFKSFWKEGKRKSKKLICLPASTCIFFPFKCRSSIDTTISMGLPIMALPFASYLGKRLRCCTYYFHCCEASVPNESLGKLRDVFVFLHRRIKWTLIGTYNSNDPIRRNNLGPNTIPSLGFHSNNTMGEFVLSISNLPIILFFSIVVFSWTQLKELSDLMVFLTPHVDSSVQISLSLDVYELMCLCMGWRS